MEQAGDNQGNNRINSLGTLALTTLVTFLCCLPGLLWAQHTGQLEQEFKNPPDSAKPRVWWHWMNGNVTKAGITADLEWMKRVGIGGFQMFDGGLSTPQAVSNRLVWMTPEWKDAFRHAADEAARLGLEMSMAASGGWSESGGPWVQPQEAMKKVVWSETIVQGPAKISIPLGLPPTNSGRFQQMGRPSAPGAKPSPPLASFYSDIRVVACRLPENELRMADLHPKVTTSAANLDPLRLMDGDFSTAVSIPLESDQSEAWIQFEFAAPYRAQALTIAISAGGWSVPNGALQCSQEGSKWSNLLSLPGPAQTVSWLCHVQTDVFPETSARFYRVLLRPATRSVTLAELELSGPRINRWHGKAAFFHTINFGSLATPPVPNNDAVAREEVLDLTRRMKPNGLLEWDAPPGKWSVLRMGWSLTGERNHPASPEATGFEVDKLNAKHVDSYVRTYADLIQSAIGPQFGKSFRYLLLDSWEAGVENWTDDMLAQFQKRRGYDPTPFLPTLTGRIIESSEVSDRFLWDFRRTIADLVAENHYGVMARRLNERGIGLYAEAMGGPTTTGDGLLSKSFVDIPMGEFWTPAQYDGPSGNADLREAASSAHIYGKKIVAAESFTTDKGDPVWASPFHLKPVGDNALALGINRIVFHTSAHQPFVDEEHRPGITLGGFGQHYTRNMTWAEQAIAFNTYLARASHLLQQGRFVADLAYFYGEGAPAAVPGRKRKPLNPAPPEGYSYDWVNADVILNRMSVKDGRLVLPDGMSYQALVVPDYVNQLTLPLLRKLRDMVRAGATLVAPRPAGSPSLADQPNDAEFHSIATELWGSIDGDRTKERACGKGKVSWGVPLDQFLAGEKNPPDFEYNRPEVDSALAWIHRRDGASHIYFVANQRKRTEDFRAVFRVNGMEAELWHPDTGRIEPAAYEIARGRTTVPLHLAPYDSVFVVFRRPAAALSRILSLPPTTELAAIQRPWQVSFPTNQGAPSHMTLNSLVSWTQCQEEGVKFFSGTATYTKEINAPPAWFKPGAKIILDLGEVREVAQAAVNGKSVGGVLWKPPFQADVTTALKPGVNRLEVKVVNLWPNRIIGDQQRGAKRRYTWLNANYKPFNTNSPLLESGLLGPVKLLSR